MGWDSFGWIFEDDRQSISNDWIVVQHLQIDKFRNPFLGVGEKETSV